MNYDTWKTTDPRDLEPDYDGSDRTLPVNDRDGADDSDRADNDTYDLGDVRDYNDTDVPLLELGFVRIGGYSI